MKKVLMQNLVWIMSFLAGWVLMMLVLASGSELAGVHYRKWITYDIPGIQSRRYVFIFYGVVDVLDS